MPDNIEGQGQDPSQTAESQSQESSEDTGSRVERRIAQLTAARRQAESDRDQLQGTVASMAAKLSELESRLTAPAPRQDPFAAESPRQSPNAIGDANINAIIEQAVQKAVAPFQQERARTALVSQQQNSFEEAAEYLPDVRDPRTKAGQLFAQIYDGNPDLQRMPNGPALVVNAVAGILGPQPVNGKDMESRKLAASTTNPGSPRQHIEDGDSSAGKAKEALINKLASNMREGLTEEELSAYMGLKMGVAKPSQK